VLLVDRAVEPSNRVVGVLFLAQRARVTTGRDVTRPGDRMRAVTSRATRCSVPRNG